MPSFSLNEIAWVVKEIRGVVKIPKHMELGRKKTIIEITRNTE